MPDTATPTTTTERVLPGAEGRADYLAGLTTKAALQAELALLESEQAQATADNLELSASVRELGTQLRDAEAATGGLLPMVLHVAGVEWAGTQRRLHRCAAHGELAESWLVQVGDKMLTRSGHAIPFRAYRFVGASLQDKVRHTLDDAIAAARGYTPKQ